MKSHEEGHELVVPNVNNCHKLTHIILCLTALFVVMTNIIAGFNSCPTLPIYGQQHILLSPEWIAETTTRAGLHSSPQGSVPKRDRALLANKIDKNDKKIQVSMIVSGVAKGVPPFKIPATVQRLVELGEMYEKHHIVIVQSGIYSNETSTPTIDLYTQAFQDQGIDPSTYTVLSEEEELEKKGNASEIIFERVQRIARARNLLLHYIHSHFPSYEYQIVTDLDGTVCHDSSEENPANHFDHSVFRRAFELQEGWDALSFRVRPYWDLWAFRHREQMPYSRFGLNNHLNLIQAPEQMDEWLDTLPSDQLTEIESGFMFLSIYRLKATLGITYDASDCEHVPFHSMMKEKNEAKIRLLPLEYCAPGQKVENYFL